MSRVSHFQRFSQPENHATNNTLLLIRHLYQVAPLKVQKLLSQLLELDEDRISLGLQFRQQVQGKASVPDALIVQDPLRIYVETKRGGRLDADQLRRHFETIEFSSQQSSHHGLTVLLGLTKEQLLDSDRNQLREDAKLRGITFVSVTFSQIAEAARATCENFERTLISIVDDYDSFLADEHLLEERNHWLVVFPCGVSLAENARFHIYYQSPSRPSCANYRYIGVYDRKRIAYVGTLQATAIATWESGQLKVEPESGVLTDAHQIRIRDVIQSTPYYDLKAAPYRYYLVDSFEPTNAQKSSPGGIMALRYLELTKLVPTYNPRKGYTTKELSTMLDGATWE